MTFDIELTKDMRAMIATAANFGYRMRWSVASLRWDAVPNTPPDEPPPLPLPDFLIREWNRGAARREVV